MTLAPPPATMAQILPWGLRTVSFKDAPVIKKNNQHKGRQKGGGTKGKAEGWRDEGEMWRTCFFIKVMDELFFRWEDLSKRRREIEQFAIYFPFVGVLEQSTVVEFPTHVKGETTRSREREWIQLQEVEIQLCSNKYTSE